MNAIDNSESHHDDQFKYWAFISYSSKDASVAKRLHHHLETYRIPKELVGRPGRDKPVPKRLFPVFRDRDELPLSSDLGASIQGALQSSRYLVVLCSQNAAESRWVNEEIRYFKSLGRDDQILAVIVDGIPNGSDNETTATKECFPPALRYRLNDEGLLTSDRTEPIAGDLRRGGDGWTSVLLKAVAGITGMGYDAFAKREAKRVFRKRVNVGLVVFVLCCMGLLYWDYSRLKVEHYAASTERWGVPIGVSPLNEYQRARRETSYRFESRGYKVRRVVRVNSAGSLIDDSDSGVSRTDIVYREDGSLERLLLANRNGKLLLQKSFSKPGDANALGLHPCAITFLSKSEFAQTMRANAANLAPDSDQSSELRRSDITAYLGFFDSRGRLVAIYFRNSYGSPVSDPNGVFGQRFEFNEDGIIVKTTNLDAAGNPTPDRRGVQSVIRDYGALSAMVRQGYLDYQDQPILGPDQVAAYKYQLDNVGNQIERDSLTTDGMLTLNKQGVARIQWGYDSKGNNDSMKFFDIKGAPTLNRDGYAGFTMEHAPNGRMVGLAYFGIDGQPTVEKNGIASYAFVIDANGNQTETKHHGTDGRPTNTAYGWSSLVTQYDILGNPVDTSTFDANGQPVFSKLGLARVVQVFDDRGFVVQRRFFGLSGEPCTNSSGIAMVVILNDERGNPTEEAYYGTDGLPTITQDGISKMVDRFDDHGNLVERTFQGVKGELISHRDGYARFTQKYDDHGHLIEVAYFDTNVRPVLSKDGYAKRQIAYDQNGFEVRRDFFGVDGRPILDKKGRARVAYVNDSLGNRIEERQFGTNYLPVADQSDVSIIKTDRDVRGNITSVRTFGPTGRPVLHKTGKFARVDTTYDDRGNQTSIAYFGTGGEPVLGGAENVARRIQQYDSRNNLIEVSYFGLDGAPCRNNEGFAKQIVEYDDRDNRTRLRFFGMDGQPITNAIGIAVVKTKFDAMSRQIDESYFGLNDEPIVDADGVAQIAQSYNARGNMIGQAFFGTDGTPTLGSLGFSRSEAEYDAGGNVIDFKTYGIDEQLVIGRHRFAHQVSRYDAVGRLLEMKLFGIDGKPCLGTEGFAHLTAHYDRNGKNIETATYGVDGKLIRARGRYARLTAVYDESGKPVEQSYFDENGHPTLSFEGVAKATIRYDKKGNHVETSCFGVDGKLVINKDHYARLLLVYDGFGRLIEEVTYGVSGEMVVSSRGYAKELLKYDEAGNIIEESYFGPDDRPMASRKNGVAKGTVTYNEAGQMTELRRFGADGKDLQNRDLPYLETQIFHPNGVCAKYEAFSIDPRWIPNAASIEASSHIIVKYDDQGNVYAMDAYNFLPPQNRGKGKAVLEHQIYDSAGRRIGTEYLNELNQLVMGPNGCARDQVTLDDFGQAIRVEGFDDMGNRSKVLLVAGTEVHAGRVDMKYDRFGRPIEYLIYDDNDQLIVSETVPNRMTHEFGTTKEPVSVTQYFSLPKTAIRTALGSPPIRIAAQLGPNGKPTEATIYREVAGSVEDNNLIVSVTRTDSAKRILEVKFEDSKGHLVIGPAGFARQTQTYDLRGQPLVLRYYGVDGPMVDPKSGVFGMDIVRDLNGRVAEQRRIGVDEKPIENSEGVAITRQQWDREGRLLEEAYFDRHDKPVLRNTVLFATLKISYDDKAQTSQQRYFDQSGNETKSAVGIFRKVAKTDTQGRVTEEHFYDTDDHPMRSNQGICGILRSYGRGTQPIEIVSVDEEGNPLNSRLGYAKTRYERDAQGNALVEEYLDLNNTPVCLIAQGGHHRIETKFNSQNLPTARTFIMATEDQPAGATGYAKLVTTLDARGNVLESLHLNAVDQPVMNPDGYAVLRKRYDSQGHVVEDAFFDTDNQPCKSKAGYHRSTQRFEGERVAELCYFDKDGDLVNGPFGFAHYERNQATDGGRPTWKVLDHTGDAANCEVAIDQILPGSQAEGVGLAVNDVILSYDGVPVRHMLQIIELAMIGTAQPRSIEISRNGKSMKFVVERGRIGAGLRVRAKSQ